MIADKLIVAASISAACFAACLGNNTCQSPGQVGSLKNIVVMKTCPHCDGELLRHGMTDYKRDQSIVGVRYKCRECNKTFTVREQAGQSSEARLHFNQAGRPFIKDWRMKDTMEARTQ